MASPAANLLGKILPAAFALFAAATLVLWGATGQFVVALLLVLELRHASVIAASTAWILGVLDVALALAVLAYVFHAVARPQTRKVEGPAAATADLRAGGWTIP
jgi:hypothetical protein